MKRLTLLIALMLIFAQVSAFAQITAVPQRMHFQGRLAKPDGTPVLDGNYSVRFSLWTAVSGGVEKWSQTVNPVMVKSGTFSVPLNTSTGAADKFNNNLFLEIKIGADAPLTPRQPLASVAYAMKADSVKDGSITANSLANNAVTGAKIADNAVTTGKLANGSITSAKLDSSLQGMLGGFTSDTDHTALVGNVAIGGPVQSVAVSGNYAYMIAGSGGVGSLLIYNVSSPTNPTYINSIVMAGTPKTLVVSGIYAYVLTNANLLRIYDVSNPANPTFRGSIATVNTSASMAASGNHVYVVGGARDLQIFNVSNPVAPFLQGTGTTNPGTLPCAVAVSGNHAFVATRGNGPEMMQSFDVSNPAAPIARGVVETGGDPNFIKISGNYAYVTHQLPTGPLQIYNISNPAAPTLVNTITTADYPVSVAVSGPFAYVACSSGFVQSFYVADPLVPLYIEGLTTRRGHTSVAASNNCVYVVDRGNLDNSGMLQVFERRTQGINSNFFARGGGFFYGGLDIDQGALNNGGLASGLTFGPASGEGIASKRTYGGNGLGLDFYTAFQNRMCITNSGNVGIGITTPTRPLEVDGTVAADFFFTTSDARYKKNVATLENPLETILNLRGVTYEWKQNDFPDRNFDAGRQIGFIAQEVEKVLPEVVSTDAKGYKSVAYQNVVPILVEAVKTQQKQHESDRAEIRALQTEIAELKALVQRLAEQQKAGQK